MLMLLLLAAASASAAAGLVRKASHPVNPLVTTSCATRWPVKPVAPNTTRSTARGVAIVVRVPLLRLAAGTQRQSSQGQPCSDCNSSNGKTMRPLPRMTNTYRRRHRHLSVQPQLWASGASENSRVSARVPCLTNVTTGVNGLVVIDPF